jgi:hypothetical protein
MPFEHDTPELFVLEINGLRRVNTPLLQKAESRRPDSLLLVDRSISVPTGKLAEYFS